MPTYEPISPARLVEACVDLVGRQRGVVVGGVDGADAAAPVALAESVATALRERGRPAAVVHLRDYIRPASVRMEHGDHDVEGFRTGWFDYAALDREVIGALRRDRTWLPRLWDERTDRSFRDRVVVGAPEQVVLVAGPMLLGRGLDLSPTVSLQMSAAALRRATPTSQVWTVEALVAHDEIVSETPDLTVRCDHPTRPAIRRH